MKALFPFSDDKNVCAYSGQALAGQPVLEVKVGTGKGVKKSFAVLLANIHNIAHAARRFGEEE